jgi:hypothetical protein
MQLKQGEIWESSTSWAQCVNMFHQILLIVWPRIRFRDMFGGNVEQLHVNIDCYMAV